MTPPTEADLGAIADRALRHARDEAQVTVAWERSVIAAGGSTRTVDVLSVDVLAVAGGAIGQTSTTETDDDSLARAVAGAERLASAGQDVQARLPDPAPGRTHDGYDAALLGIDPAAVELPAHVTWEAGAAKVLVRSTRGVDAYEQRTFNRGTYDWREHGRGVRLTAAAVGRAGLDLEALAAEATELGAAPAEGDAPAGETAVVLGPQAVAEVLEWLRWTFTPNGEALRRRGERITAPCINLSDSPRFAATLPRSFDVEGVPRQPVPLIQDGVAHRVVWDTVSAAVAGEEAASTGHAGSPARPLPFPHHFVLVGGGAADVAELARTVDRGLFLAAIPQVESGEDGVLVAEGGGAFAIRGGELAEPLGDPRVEVRPLEILASAQALTSRQRLIPTYGSARNVGATVAPALRAAGGLRVL